MSWIRDGREQRGLSQANLARVTGIVQSQLSAWELEKARPTACDRERIRAIFRQLDRGELPKGLLVRNHAPAAPAPPRRTKTRWFAPLERFARGERSARPTALACFAGCGGLALGFAQSGFSVVGHVEIDHDARRTFARNFPRSVPLACDVRDVRERHVRAWLDRFGAIDVLCGGPPCQGFSLAGKRDPNDARNPLFRDYLRIAEALAPSVVVMENVRELVSVNAPDGRPMLAHIREEFDKVGYRVEAREWNACDFGAPQFRQRLLFVAVRRQSPIAPFDLFPAPTHSGPYRTFRDATGDLEPLESGERSTIDPHHWAVAHPPHVLRWLEGVPEGKSAHDNADPRLRPPSGYNTTYKRLRWDEPCATIGTTFGMISGCRTVHPSCTRSLTIREAIRCQTFPDDFVFEGTAGKVRRQIGNAVPPIVAKALARHIASVILPSLNRAPAIADAR